jgi:YgiT-type zinc finger domain-containing protein
MRCLICHSPDIEIKQINEEVHSNSDIIYIPISIPVCQNCGERYYDRKTMQYLERTKKQLKENKIQLREIGKIKLFENSSILE